LPHNAERQLARRELCEGSRASESTILWAQLSVQPTPRACPSRRSTEKKGVRPALRLALRLAGPKLKDPIPNLTPIFQPNHQTLEGSFSSASKPIFAPKYAFFSIFRGLQDLQSFATLRFQKLSKIS